ncbi:MAG: BspA family leucine-rich repeat surface protein [Oscillospiraceae bacterium]|nr:BspA family leucine-rich repeat surface protein [Oscillospiraceae bacterium]
MKKRMKTVAAFCAAAILCGAVPAAYNIEPLFDYAVTASAEGETVSFDATTKTLTLNAGNVAKGDVQAYAANDDVQYVVAEEGAILPANCGNLFKKFKATSIDISKADASSVTTMNNMFADSSLSEVKLPSSTSNVKDMGNMFASTQLVTLDLSDLDTSSVLNMSSMFESCPILERIIVSDKWSTAKVTAPDNMLHMFNGCISLKGGAGTAYDASETDMSYAHVDGGEENPGYLTSKNQTLADGKYKQTAKKDGTYYTRFVFVTPKSEIAGKSKAKFTATHDGTEYTYETNKYYTGMISNSINYTAASADSVLFVVTVSSGSDISADLTCDITFE